MKVLSATGRQRIWSCLLVVVGLLGCVPKSHADADALSDSIARDLAEALRRSPAIDEGLRLLRRERMATVDAGTSSREFRESVSEPACRERGGSRGHHPDSVRFLDDHVYEVGDEPFSVATGHFNRDRRIDVATANYAGRSISVLLQSRQGVLVDRRDIPVDGTPYDLACADFNGDRFDDLAVALVGEASVLVLLSDGRGGFVEEGRYSVGRKPAAVIFADLDADGRLDLVCTNSADSTISVLRGTGIGQGGGGRRFEAWSTLRVGRSPQELLAGDFNQDGKLDLVVACVGLEDPNLNRRGLAFLAGNGIGGFAAPKMTVLDRVVRSLAAADFDGDADLDIVVGVPIGLLLALNDSRGSFAPQPSARVGWDERIWVAPADLDEDGDEDLLVACAGYGKSRSGFVAVSLNDHGSFGPTLYYLAQGGTFRVEAADLNGDGHADAVAVNGPITPEYPSTVAPSTISIFLGQGNGELEGISRKLLNDSPEISTRKNRVFALERGGHPRPQPPDLLVTTWEDARVMRNQGNGRFGDPVLAVPGPVIHVRDLTGDGVTDLTCNAADGKLSVLLGDRNGGFRPADQLIPSGKPADVDGDGLPEFVHSVGSRDSVVYLPNLGGGRFGAARPLPGVRMAGSLGLGADLNGDGVDEILICRSSYSGTDTLSVFESLRGRGYRLAASIPFEPRRGAPSRSVGAASIQVHANRRDGSADIAILSDCGDCVFASTNVFHRDRHGVYAHTDYHVGLGGEWTYMAFADFSGDGLADVVTGADDIQDRGAMQVLRNVGDGSCEAQATLQLGAEISSMTTTDVDLDGQSDVVVLSSQRGSLTVLRSAARKASRGPRPVDTDEPRAPGGDRRASPMLVLGDGTAAPSLQLSVATAGPAHLALYDISGRRVISRDLGWLAAGEHAIDVRGIRTLRPGVYWARVAANGTSELRKVVVMNTGGGR